MSKLTNRIQAHASRSDVVSVKARGDRQVARLVKTYAKRGYVLQSQTRSTFGANHLLFVRQQDAA